MSKCHPPTLVLAIGLVAGCQDVAAPPQEFAAAATATAGGAALSEWITSELDFRDPGFPVYLDCLDETVLWTGVVRYEDHWVYRPDGTFHLNGRATLLSGTSLVGASGTWTPVKVVSYYVHDMVVPDFQGAAAISERITWENQESGALMAVALRRHVVFDGKGNLVRQTPWVYECQLQP